LDFLWVRNQKQVNQPRINATPPNRLSAGFNDGAVGEGENEEDEEDEEDEAALESFGGGAI